MASRDLLVHPFAPRPIVIRQQAGVPDLLACVVTLQQRTAAVLGVLGPRGDTAAAELLRRLHALDPARAVDGGSRRAQSGAGGRSSRGIRGRGGTDGPSNLPPEHRSCRWRATASGRTAMAMATTIARASRRRQGLLPQPGPTPMRRDDEVWRSVFERVRRSDFTDLLAGLYFEVRDGVVCVQGEVSRAAEVPRLLTLVWGVPGVAGVRDALTFCGETPAELDKARCSQAPSLTGR